MDTLKEFLVWDHIPLQQGLRLIDVLKAVRNDNVWDHIPLQQGLRLVKPALGKERCLSLRPYSITTRIKTPSGLCWCIRAIRVWDHIPLQQGLRLKQIFPWNCYASRLRPYSITTRIKTLFLNWYCNYLFISPRPYSITTRIKTERSSNVVSAHSVRDHIPLQQGLRLFSLKRGL